MLTWGRGKRKEGVRDNRNMGEPVKKTKICPNPHNESGQSEHRHAATRCVRGARKPEGTRVFEGSERMGVAVFWHISQSRLHDSIPLGIATCECKPPAKLILRGIINELEH